MSITGLKTDLLIDHSGIGRLKSAILTAQLLLLWDVIGSSDFLYRRYFKKGGVFSLFACGSLQGGVQSFMRMKIEGILELTSNCSSAIHLCFLFNCM